MEFKHRLSKFIINFIKAEYLMWKSFFYALLFLGISCFTYANMIESFDQVVSDLVFDDQEVVEITEDTIVINVDQLEDLIEEVNRSKFFSSERERIKIWFVNNTNPLPGNGSYRNPFNTLLAAQEASKKGDIIFVFPGDNTTKGMDQGFIMKKDQRLLGAGVHHRIDFPDKKLFVRAPSTTLPRITNTSGSVVILANSCEVSGFNIVDIVNGDGILGGDPNSAGPQTRGIKNTIIKKNVIGTFRHDQNLVLNGAIYLPNCRGKLVIQHNYILNVLATVQASGTGIHLLNANFPISSHVTIRKNIVSNTGSTGIILSHRSPKGKVKADIEDNIVFNIGQVGDAIFIGTEGMNAGGHLCAEIKKNFCQNVHAGFDLHLQSSGKSHVKAQVKGNVVARSATLESGGFLPGFSASSLDSSYLCLKLVKNFSELGYEFNQLGTSHFKLELPHKNLGLPFTVNGKVKTVHSGKCNCEHSSSGLHLAR